MTCVLVIDDDPTVREVVVGYLSSAGMRTLVAADGVTGLDVARAEHPDVVVLDLMLPGLDGMEVFRRLRRHSGHIPVVMLTARGEEPDRILGLEVGADDYVAKPFSPRELVLRIQSVLRRFQPPAADASAADTDSDGPAAGSALLVDGDLSLDPTARRATRSGAPLPLTIREFDLLAYLLAHPGTAFSREELMRQVWGWEFGDQSTVTVHVRRLREKVEADPRTPARLVTVWGVGYRWDPPGSVGLP